MPGVVDIGTIAEQLGVPPDCLLPYGRQVAKIHLDALKRPSSGVGKLVLVSATTPTPAGEGKTTTSIGLAQALAKLGASVCLALREASLGPCLGRKGGATGGGRSSLVPAERINLHFTGDFHAVTSANNLLSAIIDNHIYHGNALAIDPRRVVWRRVMDMNDRSLRHIIVGLGGTGQGIPREGGFDITAASEVMAMLCLAEDSEDLRRRIDRTLVAYRWDGEPVYAGELGVTGAMLALLRDAIHPNLVQTGEGVPALVHGGPFANIAHGCSSLIATRMALHYADWGITEAGFGFDLGAEKFFDIKCRLSGLDPVAVVLVTTVRALKMHGGQPPGNPGAKNIAALRRGLVNLDKHIENVGKFNKRPVVALNHFAGDSEQEIALVVKRCEEQGVACAVCRHFEQGGKGAIELARAVMDAAASTPFAPLYPLDLPVEEKIRVICREIYGADDVAFTRQAERDLRQVTRLGLDHLPVCVAKAPTSLSDNPALKGRPRDFDITVRAVQVNSGAGFLVVLTGDVLRMPGLPKAPLAERIDLGADGRIEGL
ncbi:formate--tetrahydrofolate ligase [Geothermobacter hydrogeniphilus]|uniref:Formate--tetrahydrofolate ligase n=1 Tax=Geothermobacter hydrogeniphilus TaxID=1969733 RepID=A0A1X0Y927_9BACT|nr:formate--tetrahydrofolate ligase [Geothermobacter hydrogeniphilus]ORJ61612.1 formate--tetrahydrofolate ligase [Geothermobacter hydrogeniphilus]